MSATHKYQAHQTMLTANSWAGAGFMYVTLYLDPHQHVLTLKLVDKQVLRNWLTDNGLVRLLTAIIFTRY